MYKSTSVRIFTQTLGRNKTKKDSVDTQPEFGTKAAIIELTEWGQIHLVFSACASKHMCMNAKSHIIGQSFSPPYMFN